MSFPPLPAHLALHAPTGIHPGEPVAQFELGTLQNFVYLLIDWSARRFAIVDPQSDLSPVRQATESHGLELEAILLTHSHHDHVAGLPALHREFPKVPTLVHELDRHRIQGDPTVRLVVDGEKLRIGSLEAEAMHTPGHSAGECSYFLGGTSPPYVFTGDTVFIRDCGRTDFADGSNEQMFASLQRIAKLPPGTVILPGHHYKAECASTIARELAESPPFRCRSVSELASLP